METELALPISTILCNIWATTPPVFHLSGVFPVNLAHLSGHNARIAPYEIDQIPSKIHRPDVNIYCGLGSKTFFVIPVIFLRVPVISLANSDFIGNFAGVP